MSPRPSDLRQFAHDVGESASSDLARVAQALELPLVLRQPEFVDRLREVARFVAGEQGVDRRVDAVEQQHALVAERREVGAQGGQRSGRMPSTVAVSDTLGTLPTQTAPWTRLVKYFASPGWANSRT